MYLHVKLTKLQGKVNSDIPPEPHPFLYPSLSNISIKKSWMEVKNNIIAALKLPKFGKKYGAACIFDENLGVVGWMCKRGKNDHPRMLEKKTSVEMREHSDWKGHWEEYSTKIKNKEKEQKFFLVDLNLGVAAFLAKKLS